MKKAGNMIHITYEVDQAEPATVIVDIDEGQ
jgi:hypothetical protein